MEPFAWPLVVVVLGSAALIGFRESFSKILGGIIKVIEGIKLRKAASLEFDPVPQQQIEEAKIDAKLTPAKSAQDQSETNDLVLGPRIQAFRKELDGHSRDPTEREKLLLHVAAVWHVNHENARIARHIFGSQLEILLHLNSRPDGDTLENVQTFYDRAVQNFPETYKSYPFEPYIAFLENSELIERDKERIKITPRGKALFHYMIATGDTAPRGN